MVLGIWIELSGHVCGSGPSWADAPPSGDGEGSGRAVAVGVEVAAFVVGVCPAGSSDDSVHAVRTNSSPVSITMRDSCLMLIVVTDVGVLMRLCFSVWVHSCNLTHIFAKEGSYASGEEIGEDMGQITGAVISGI